MKTESNHHLSLLPLRTKRLSELAVDQITGLIEEGHLKIGDKLPSEKELTVQLGISRASAREALRILESQGLVEVLPGKGAFVIDSPPQTDVTQELQAWFSKHREEVFDVLAVRELLEGYAAYEAAKALTKELIDELKASVEEMERCIEEGSLVEVTNADRKFHRLLYEASGNRLLKLLGDGIVGAMFGPRYSLLRIPGQAQKSVKDHKEILEYLMSGDPEKAMDATRRHVDSTRRGIAANGPYVDDES
ncbi:MAG: FadR family transcriptional regulator [Candidatus Promineofilum sp.]|nr:FadR family transcriptional regulator [Promineifilum sp.]